MEIKIIQILVFAIFILNTSSIIIIPFQTYNPLLTRNETLLELIKNSTDKTLVDTLTRNLIYSNLNIGQNPHIISTFIEMSTKEFILRDIKNYIPNQNTKKENIIFCLKENILLKNLFKSEYYNSTNSISYSFIEDCYDISYLLIPIKNICGNEIVLLTKKDNYLDDKGTFLSTDFYIKFKSLDEYDQRPGFIGFNYNSIFISNLKEREKINKYTFLIKYTNLLEDQGEIIIGDLPHIYDSNKYKENNLRSAKINKDDILIKWRIDFDIYISPKNKKDFALEIDDISIFYIEEFFITGSYKYFTYIEEKFFKKYIDKKICKKNINNKPYDAKNYFYFICYIDNENQRKELFNEFPNLILYQKEMDCNFTFTAEDLFTIIPDGRRILFNIDFLFNSNNWILGKPFFKKFEMIFDSDSNLVSYYINPNSININKEEDNKGGKGLKIFLIIFLTIFAFAVGIIFGRALCVKYNRKMRANELEDNYSYITYDPNNKDNEKGLSDNNFKSKYYNLN